MGNNITKYDYTYDLYIAKLIIYCKHLLSDKNDKLLNKSFLGFSYSSVTIGAYSFKNNGINIIVLWKLTPYNRNENIDYPVKLIDKHYYIYGILPSITMTDVDSKTKLYDVTDNKWINGVDPIAQIKKEIENFAIIMNSSTTYVPTFSEKLQQIVITNNIVIGKSMTGGDNTLKLNDKITSIDIKNKVNKLMDEEYIMNLDDSEFNQFDNIDLKILEEMLKNE
jgi:hypothetical protein